MVGKIVDGHGNTLKAFPPTGDIVPVSMFLQAAGISLGDVADSSTSNKTTDSKRDSGVLLLVAITYDNGGVGRPTYVYNVAAIPNSEYKMVEAINYPDSPQGETRKIINRHGVKLVFLTTGNIGRFDFQTLLIQLVSALGLLGVATLVVELFMLYVLPHRRFYNKYKFEETVDFSDIRDAEDESTEDPRFAVQLNRDLAQLRRQPLMEPAP